MNHLKKLSWLLSAGITDCIGETSHNKLINDEKKGSEQQTGKEEFNSCSSISQAEQTAEKATTLDQVNEARCLFNDCSLKKTATHTLIGRGVIAPTVLCIGDVPNGEDDRSNLVFSGEIGALLDRMLAAIGLSLEKNTYVNNLIPWRPPGNRKPTETEIAQCLPFLKKEINLLCPKALLLFGNLPAEALLHVPSVPKARGMTHVYKIDSGIQLPTIVTFHPSTVLKLPAQRKPVWEDLQRLQKILKEQNLL